jgi:hypothetical protein
MALLRKERLSESPMFRALIFVAGAILLYGIFAFMATISDDKAASRSGKDQGTIPTDENFFTIEAEAEKVLAEGKVREILTDFAFMRNAALMTEGDDLLLDAASGKNDNLRARLEEAEADLETEKEQVEDAIDMRGYKNAATKVCIVRSILDNDLTSTCDLMEPAELDVENIDDITAVEEVLPAFLSGVAYYTEGDYGEAEEFLERVASHKDGGIALWEDADFPLGSPIYKKIQDETARMLADEKLSKSL